MELDNQNIEAQDVQPLEGNTVIYQDDKVVTLDPMEHIRRRPGMYIGKLGDGTSKAVSYTHLSHLYDPS